MGYIFWAQKNAHLMIFVCEEAKAESAAISQPVVVNGSNQGGQNVTASHATQHPDNEKTTP